MSNGTLPATLKSQTGSSFTSTFAPIAVSSSRIDFKFSERLSKASYDGKNDSLKTRMKPSPRGRLEADFQSDQWFQTGVTKPIFSSVRLQT